MGGFHLMGYGERSLTEIIKKMKKIGVKKVAPSHCTGENAINLFRNTWKKGFLEGGCGAVIKVPW